MRILLIGEASFLHNTLKRGLVERGNSVVTMSDGNGWHNAPRDINLRRDPRWGKLGGLKVVWQLLRHFKALCGNDIVQIHNYQFVPLKGGWNVMLLRFLKLVNRRVVKGCYGDDPQIFRRQAEGVPAYSDTYWHGMAQNMAANRARIAEVMLPSAFKAWRKTSLMADALVPCLYEYWLDYDEPPFADRVHYIGLPVVLPKPSEVRQKGDGDVIRVLVGLQPGREFMKGAKIIAAFVETVARRHTGKVIVEYVEGVPYGEYMRMLSEADVLVDQFYSFTPSMNSLAAMARGTVVIGGGEEDYYEFIGEKRLRPIINVSPELSDDANVATIEHAFFGDGGNTLSRLSRESVSFVAKYHDYRLIAAQYEKLYDELLNIKS